MSVKIKLRTEFKIDLTCIACDTCSNMSPNHFALTEDGELAYMKQQPQNTHDINRCIQAQEACPVGAISQREP